MPERKAKYGEALNLIQKSIEGRAEYQNAFTVCERMYIRVVKSLISARLAADFMTALKSGDNREDL